MRPLIAVLLVAAVAGAWSVLPAVAADPSVAVGAQVHGAWSDWTQADVDGTLDALAAAGATWIRVDVGWSALEEAGPGQISTWYRDRVDKVVNGARARGLKVLATLWSTPEWANGGQTVGVPPTDVNEYARHARWAAEYWKGRVAAWEVWNEPNLEWFWEGADPVTYTQLLRAAYPSFKAGDPGAQVVFGGPAFNDVEWLAAAYAAGAGGHFDVMATHPYQGKADEPPGAPDEGEMWRLTHVPQVRQLMQANGDAGKPIWFTEFGWSSHANTVDTKIYERGVTEQQQGQYMVDSLELIRTQYPYVTNVFWYSARAKTTGDVHQDGYGLMTSDLMPKPALTMLDEYLHRPAGTSTPTPAPVPAPVAVVPTPATSSSSSPGVPTPTPVPDAAGTPAPVTSATPAPDSTAPANRVDRTQASSTMWTRDGGALQQLSPGGQTP